MYETTESVSDSQLNSAKQISNFTFDFAVLFLLGIIVGLLVFKQLSERWHT